MTVQWTQDTIENRERRGKYKFPKSDLTNQTEVSVKKRRSQFYLDSVSYREKVRLARVHAKISAFALHRDIGNEADFDHQNAVEHCRQPEASSSENFEDFFEKRKILTVGTDCSGIEAPIQALKNMNVPFRHVFSSESDAKARLNLQANFAPETLYDDVYTRVNQPSQTVDLYACGFPCQPFSSMGQQQGFSDTKEEVKASTQF